MADKINFSLAQLSGRPTLKNNLLRDDALNEEKPQTVRKPPAASVSPEAGKPSDPVVTVRTFGVTRTAIEKAIAAIGKAGGTLYFSNGTWEIDDDITIPARVAVRFDRGALLHLATKKASGALASIDEPCPGTISAVEGSTQMEGKDTEFIKLHPGQFITCNGQRREIRGIISNTRLEVWRPFQQAVRGAKFTKSSYTIKGSGTKFNPELEVGDFLYHGQEKLIVTSISGPEALTAAEYPTQPFSGQAFSRSVRVIIEGSLEAGLYQVFSGQGVVKFAPGAVASVHPEWWGAKGNNADHQATANSNAIEKAIHSMVANKRAAVEFANGTYKIHRPVVLLPGTYLRGQGMGWGGTVIALAPRSNCHMVKDSLRIHYYPGGIKGIMFNNGSQDGGYNGIHFIHNTKLWQIENCGFVSYTKHPGGYAVYLNPAAQTWVRENFIMGFHNGIYAYGFDSYYLNNEIAAGGDYAIYMIGDGNVVQGNILYGDSGCKTGIYTKTSRNTSIIGNRIGPFDNGIIIDNDGGIIEGNIIIGNRINGINSEKSVDDAIISNNRIIANKSFGICITGGCVNSIINNNYMKDNNDGKANPQIKIDSYVTPGQEEPLVEDNVGVDLQSDYALLASNGTPNIRTARRWKTANIQPVTINDFLGGCRGKEILVIFGDAQTTLKFSGNTKLRGHGGQDWRPAPGDHLRALKGDDGYWYCECSNNFSRNQ